MSVIITARRQGVLVLEEMAAGEEADRLFAIAEKAHPDCEILMKATTGAILLSVGPRPHSRREAA